MQHDIYHVYTVDQHALYAVGQLHALARGEHADQVPVPPRRSRRSSGPALALGTLLHDVGKPYGSPHSEIGAGLARTIAGAWASTRRHPAGRVPGRQHLVMDQMSQRRDLDDMG